MSNENNIDQKKPLIDDDKNANDLESLNDMIADAITLLSDESDDHDTNGVSRSTSTFTPKRPIGGKSNLNFNVGFNYEQNNNGYYQTNDSDEDYDETKRLLPPQPSASITSTARRKAAASSQQLRQQHHHDERHHHHHHLQRKLQADRDNKCGGEHHSADIVNENNSTADMGLKATETTQQLNQLPKHPQEQHTNDIDIDLQMEKGRSLCSINWYIYLVTILSAIGGFLFGYDTGIVSGAMVFIRDYFGLSTWMEEIVISVTILTAWIFSFVAGYLSNKFGRKLVIILASFVFTVGGVTLAMAHNESILIIGRATVGLAIGLASMAIPVYIAEVAPVQIRGKLVSTNVCFITFGQFVASIVAGLFSYDSTNGWRWMLGLASVPSFLQMVFFCFLPESPRWLVQQHRYDEAYAALRKFRYADTFEEEIKTEFDNIKDSCESSERERKNDTSIRTILSNRAILRALFVGSMLSIFQQVAGINTVMYYSATIIQMSGVHDKSTAVWLSALTASINFIFSFAGLVLVERLGRRLLTLTSLFGVVISLIILAAGFQLAHIHSPPVSFKPDDQIDSCSLQSTCDQCLSNPSCGYCFYDSNVKTSQLGSLMASKINGTCLVKDSKTGNPYSNSSFCVNGTDSTMTWTNNWCPSQYSWMTLAGLMLYLFFFAPGMGPMPWTINSEIYPLWARSFCYSISTSFNWFFNLLVSLTFLTLTHLLTTYGAFYLYAGLALSGLILFFFILPETKGKTLEEIEVLFQGPLYRIAKNANNLSQYNHVDGSVNASQSTVMTSSTSSSAIKM